MAYQKIGFKNGDVLTAEQLAHMEDGIVAAEKKAPSGGGASLPAAAPYQQLVTDGEGKWVAEERLAWKETKVTRIGTYVDETVGVFEPASNNKRGLLYNKAYDGIFSKIVTSAGDTVEAVIDGNSYFLTVKGNNGARPYFIGNKALENSSSPGEDTGEVILYNESVPVIILDGTVFSEGSHTIALYKVEIDETTHPIPAEYIPRIVFAYDGTNYTCNVPFEKFRDVLMSGVPVVLVDTKEGALSMDAVVYTYEDADAAIHSETFGWNLSYGEDGVSVPAAPPS